MDGVKIHTLGATGEYTVSLYLNQHWHDLVEQLGHSTPPDVGQDIQVRTCSKPFHNLIVHESDPSEHRFVLAIVEKWTVTLRGWISGKDAKQRKYWRDPSGKDRPAYFVPREDLLPIESLACQRAPRAA